jgi:hypothetical protein
MNINSCHVDLQVTQSMIDNFLSQNNNDVLRSYVVSAYTGHGVAAMFDDVVSTLIDDDLDPTGQQLNTKNTSGCSTSSSGTTRKTSERDGTRTDDSVRGPNASRRDSAVKLINLSADKTPEKQISCCFAGKSLGN